MNEEKCNKIALFRYGIISDIVNQTFLGSGKQEDLLGFKCSCKWKIPYSDRNIVSRSTIIRWINIYKTGGEKIEALYPQKRNDINKSRVIDKMTAHYLRCLIDVSDIHSVAKLIQEMKRRDLIRPGLTFSISTAYRFLHNNDLMGYLKKSKNNNKSAIDNQGENELWMQRLLQGEIDRNDLKKDLYGRIPGEDVDSLYDCILNRPLRYRKRAAGILSLSKGISRKFITGFLFIPRSTLLRNFKIYSNKGINYIVSDIRKWQHIYDDPNYIERFFSILHSPPFTYGFNRTTWRQKDIRQVMSDYNMPISNHALQRIIDDSGYKYRKAKTTLTSNDPKYREKIKEINYILSNLKERESFFSIDEYGPFAIKMYGGKTLVPIGTTKIIPQWQKTKGSLIITAALELSTNQITHFYSKNKDTNEMIKLLDLLLNQYSCQDCIYFSWDAASWHASRNLQERVDKINSKEFKENVKSPIVKLAPLPTSSQFLNVIESVFSGMAKAIIHNSDYKSVDECRSAIDRYFSERNAHFKKYPKRAGNKIWGKERVRPAFAESNNCKDPLYR